MAAYAYPEMLVETIWVVKHSNDAGIRLVEVDFDASTYDDGHIEGAIRWSWNTQLCDITQRNIIQKDAFERLMVDSGIGNDTTVILYGDEDNSFAAWALWQMKIHGHKHVRLMNGGRKKWISEGNDLTTDVRAVAKMPYCVRTPDISLRVFLPDVQRALNTNSHRLVDVRNRDEFIGNFGSRRSLQDIYQLGGHVPGAISIPWELACSEDGCFKSVDELAALYWSRGITSDKPVIVYGRIGVRSCHTWFVLKYVLGYQYVANYDGSWVEWSNRVRAPVERGRCDEMSAADIAAIDAALVEQIKPA